MASNTVMNDKYIRKNIFDYFRKPQHPISEFRTIPILNSKYHFLINGSEKVIISECKMPKIINLNHMRNMQPSSVSSSSSEHRQHHRLNKTEYSDTPGMLISNIFKQNFTKIIKKQRQEIEIIMQETGVSREQAVEAFKDNNYDAVNTIMDLQFKQA